ncbi:DUF6035 family protein [Pseudoxanthomonas sacheonensis]|uniref:DUF6035 family protein n=1 Tax=Pseudoxanthomonas sacheonensis TaxID=443615 RepID=UPI0013D82DFE|nr:DUF6035 family protein [Pseudoxanthomonas sacheonensis]KAF1710181.1 hypothetical protein CSC73_05765 [Pseudoxanthomonas sacheonensis]
MSAAGSERRAVPAEDRQYDQVWDKDAGDYVSLTEFLGDGTYGEIIADRRVALENDLVEGKERFVCPDCEKAMVLRSIPTRDRTEDRFYFRHRIDDGTCSGRKGLSPAAICARKYDHAKEGVRHKLFKQLIAESIAADPRFTDTRVEARWKDADGVRWRQPDVQSVWQGRRVAFEVQLSTTFLHVIAERMTFYRHNDGALLWLFRDLNPDEFKLAEDDIFYSNNRNAFRVGVDTVERSRELGRFMLGCVWHEPHLDERGILEDRVQRRIVGFDELTFDVSAGGVPRAFYSDYDNKLAACQQKQEQERQAKREARDQVLRDALEAAVLNFSMADEGNDDWLEIRQRFLGRGFDLPPRLYYDEGPFYLLQAAYSAKHGKPVACGIKNLMGLANSLFNLHKDALWVFSVMLRHFDRGHDLTANGNVDGWKKKRDEYREGWFLGDPTFEPNRRYDNLLAFLFPDAAHALRQSPSLVETLRRRRQPANRSQEAAAAGESKRIGGAHGR